jgi:Zn-dependent protease with chaperone function
MEAVASPVGCPVCVSELTSDRHFVRWCRACGWNADPAPEPARSRLRRALDQRADRATRRLFDSVLAHAPSERRGVLVSVVVYAAAAAVHAVTAMFLAAAPLLLLVPEDLPTWLRIVGAALCLAIGGFVFPFTPAWRSDAVSLSRADAPTLFALIDDIARETGAPAVERVEISDAFNASYFRQGVRRRHAIELGMALWTVLDPQQRVALLGHELGHGVNGDLRNTGIVHRALLTLARWRQLLTPIRHHPWESSLHATPQEGLVGLLETVVLPVVLFPITAMIAAFSLALELVADRDGQRREYYADELSARVAGSTAAVELLDMILLGEFSRDTLIRTVRFQRTLDPWQALREAVERVPPTERERLAHNARRALGRIDSTHPPTQLRADLLRGRPARQPRVALGDDAAATIERELAPARARLARELRSALTT